jgi:small subunit ribosomal protein S17
MVTRQKIGIVVSDKLDNGIVVALDTWYKHRLYRKIMSKTKRYLVHDPHNTCKVGNIVVVEEHSPLSAKKRWILKSIVK